MEGRLFEMTEMEDRQAPRHPMGVVVRRTGLKPDLLRAWERRYGAVSPDRTDSNRRLYSDRDIERLRLLSRVTQLGQPIHRVAKLTNDELARMLRLEEQLLPTTDAVARTPFQPSAGEGQAEALLAACVHAVETLDDAALIRELERGAVSLGRRGVLEDVLAPLLHQMTDLWMRGSIRPAGEHLATTTIRSFLGRLQISSSPLPTNPTIVVTTPTGHLRELHALMVAITAANEGWNALYLGPDLPPEEIAGASELKKARAVAISIADPQEDPFLEDFVRTLRNYLEPKVHLLVGGRRSAVTDPMQDWDMVCFDSLRNLRTELSALRNPKIETDDS